MTNVSSMNSALAILAWRIFSTVTLVMAENFGLERLSPISFQSSSGNTVGGCFFMGEPGKLSDLWLRGLRGGDAGWRAGNPVRRRYAARELWGWNPGAEAARLTSKVPPGPRQDAGLRGFS